MSKPELLLTVPSVELHAVHNQQDTLLQKDTLNLYLEPNSSSAGSTILAQVAAVSWRLQRSVPCLKSEERTYIFSLPEQPGVYYCVILSPDTPVFVTESLEGVLRSSTDFSALHPSTAPVHSDVQRGSEHTPPQTAPAAPRTTPHNVSQQVSTGLVVGSGVAAHGIVGLAALTAAGIQKMTETIVKNTTPSPTGTMAPATQSKLDKAATVMGQATTVVKQLANQAGKAADGATRSMTTSLTKNQTVQKLNANPDVQILTSASKTAGAQLIVGLKEAAKILGYSTKAAVQQYKAHKYPGHSSHGTTAVGVPVAAPPPQYAPPHYTPPPSGHVPTPFDPALASAAPPPINYVPVHSSVDYPAAPTSSVSSGYAPDAAHRGVVAQETSQSGLYPIVPPPTLYPSHVPQPHAEQPFPPQANMQQPFPPQANAQQAPPPQANAQQAPPPQANAQQAPPPQANAQQAPLP